MSPLSFFEFKSHSGNEETHYRQCSDFAIRPTVRYKFDFDKSLHIASAADLDTVPLQVLLATVAATLHSAADLDTEPQGGNYFFPPATQVITSSFRES